MFDFSKNVDARILQNNEFQKTKLSKEDIEKLNEFFYGLYSGFDEEEFDSESNFNEQWSEVLLYGGNIQSVNSTVSSTNGVTKNSFSISSSLRNSSYSLVTTIMKFVRIDEIQFIPITLTNASVFKEFSYDEGRKKGHEISQHFNSLKDGRNKMVFDAFVLYSKYSKDIAADMSSLFFTQDGRLSLECYLPAKTAYERIYGKVKRIAFTYFVDLEKTDINIAKNIDLYVYEERTPSELINIEVNQENIEYLSNGILPNTGILLDQEFRRK